MLGFLKVSSAWMFECVHTTPSPHRTPPPSLLTPMINLAQYFNVISNIIYWWHLGKTPAVFSQQKGVIVTNYCENCGAAIFGLRVVFCRTYNEQMTVHVEACLPRTLILSCTCEIRAQGRHCEQPCAGFFVQWTTWLSPSIPQYCMVGG